MEDIYVLFRVMSRGMLDSFKGIAVLFVPNKRSKKIVRPVNFPKDQKMLQRIIQCCTLNGGIFCLSILIFEYIILPVLDYVLTVAFGNLNQDIWYWTRSLLSWTFGAVWVLPIFLISKIINSLWFQDIADIAFQQKKGEPQKLTKISKVIADFSFSLIVQFLFLIQSYLVSMVPSKVVSNVLGILHLSLLYSLYSFEYKWCNMGIELNSRLSIIENCWPYFLGFGFPLAIITSMPESYIISGCLFSILFPVFIISANEISPSKTKVFRLKLFAPVLYITSTIFNRSIRPTMKKTK
ncbi:etoposide-induced protein 2.4 homolog [Daktulosphaira vitifoliae]|uniref:etoposide-induced protein 2.4 homolog n=1 Tax=Daktulosphaira vitifoliae TaxID=58002 RepID=UPI0021AA5D9F|nr:etoposide-induced protein 2.4 homolog [Daktulosphaira vitifoliae]